MEFKQVIIVRSDLKMSQGKTCAQAAHASLGSAEAAQERNKDWYREWRKLGQKKVAVKAKDEEELRELYEAARALNLPCFLVQDAGLTELEPGTTTTLGIGPAPSELVDRVTGHLRLL